MRQTLVSFVTGVVHDAITVAEHCRRMTITVNDMLLVLKRRNMCDDLRALLVITAGIAWTAYPLCVRATCRLQAHAWHGRDLVFQLCSLVQASRD